MSLENLAWHKRKDWRAYCHEAEGGLIVLPGDFGDAEEAGAS